MNAGGDLLLLLVSSSGKLGRLPASVSGLGVAASACEVKQLCEVPVAELTLEGYRE
jgi:hypothetical protein